MNARLKLVWDNPAPTVARRNNIVLLRQVADALSRAIRSDQLEAARRMTAICGLSPLAMSVVATRMFRSGISEDDILKLV